MIATTCEAELVAGPSSTRPTLSPTCSVRELRGRGTVDRYQVANAVDLDHGTLGLRSSPARRPAA